MQNETTVYVFFVCVKLAFFHLLVQHAISLVSQYLLEFLQSFLPYQCTIIHIFFKNVVTINGQIGCVPCSVIVNTVAMRILGHMNIWIAPETALKEKTWLFYWVKVASRSRTLISQMCLRGLCIVEKNLLKLSSYSSNLPYWFLFLFLWEFE